MLGGIEEGGKKQMHLIYSSIRMEINGLCLSDTPPLSTHRFLLFSYHRNSAHCKCKVDTGGGRRVPLLRLNTVIRVYSNDMITHLKIKKRLSFLRKSLVSEMPLRNKIRAICVRGGRTEM